MLETKEQSLFWQGYELGLSGRCLPPKDADDWFWEGFSHGGIEREGCFKVSKWEGHRYRFRRLLFGLKNEAKTSLGLKHREFDLRTWQGISVK